MEAAGSPEIVSNSELGALTLTDLLRSRAGVLPDQVAYLFLNDGENSQQSPGPKAPAESLTYGQLDRAARSLAARLREHRGAPVLLCYPPGLDYIGAFFGCLYAGAIPVPAYPPEANRLQRTLPRLTAMLTDTGAEVALTPASLEAESALLTAQPEAAALTLLTTPGLEATASTETPWDDPGCGPDDLAFLMYTSGSTGSPRGVMVSHRNVLHNLGGFPGFATRPVTACVSWLPLFHDLGLMMGMLHPLYRGVPGIMMAPLTFAQRPLRWIEAISRYRATTTGGPNFAFDLCVAKSTPEERAALDLSAWNLALNGSEPVRRETLERFSEAFAVAGFRPEAFYPSYGLAEGTATVSGAAGPADALLLELEREALAAGRVAVAPPREDTTGGEATDGEGRRAPFVGCGPGLPDQEIAIVDPATRRRLEPDRIGEIWVRGPSVAVGYWRRPEATERLLEARLADSGEGPFLRTGDLGFLHAGEVVITGRLKDLIIIRGSNHHPEDIERTLAACHPALRKGCGAAVGVDAADGERLVVIHEINPKKAADPAAIEAAVRSAVAEVHGLELHDLVLIAPGTIPKTSSGKIRRGTCRELYRSASFEVLHRAAAARPAAPTAAVEVAHAAPSGAEVEAWLRDHLARELGADPAALASDEPFVHYGLTSIAAVSMIARLEAWLGRRLSPGLAWQYPTPARLAQHLGRSEAAAGPALRPDRPAAEDPVAIVGMGCRFPGAPGLAAFWELLRDGVDAVSEVPADRWDADAYFDPDPAAPGKMVTRWGGFLADLDRFDAAFFGLSPREAVHLDPQQRLLLEVCWEALEDAGIPPRSLAGSRSGVFVATLSNDYGTNVFTRYATQVEAYSGTGNADTMKANRLSYFLDLRGPSLSVDTACSGSLVAVHLAAESLRRGECDLALAGGVNVVLRPDANLFFSKAGALAPDGRSKPFDARANGMVRSDGAGLVVLKPLRRALADGDPVYAVVRGSAINQDGRSNGVMAPNGKAQEEVLAEAYRRAGVSPTAVQYVETHGTGTRLGDLVEANALGAVVGRGRPEGSVCALGSVKSNLGHSEAAAGIASLIKAALALRHRRLPPSLHYESPNPLIDFDGLHLAVQDRLGDWPQPQRELLAGVSSFGIGGTNAHLVLGEAPRRPAAKPGAERPEESDKAGDHRSQLLTLSAAHPEALRQLARDYGALLARPDAPSLAAVCWNAARRRSHLPHRLALTAEGAVPAAERLTAFAAGEPAAGVATGVEPGGREPRVVMVFSGQGTHWAGMGRRLLAEEPVFAEVVRRCDALLRPLAGESLLAALEAPEAEGRLEDTAVAQPAIFAIQAGLAALWSDWGIQPHAVAGQSLGEVAAAWAAGALLLEDALAVVHHRSRLMARVAGRGATVLVGLPKEETERVLIGFDGRLGVAGHSSPEATVVSGEPEAAAKLVASLTEKGLFARALAGVDVAFHSPQMAPLAEELAAALEGLEPRPARVRLLSSVTAAAAAGEDLDAAYWARNLRQPFRFDEAVAPLIAEGCEIFLEVGPHAVLGGPVRQMLAAAGREGRVLGSLRRGEDERTCLLESLGTLYAAGRLPAWERVFRGTHPALTLPSYPWQRERYWLDQLGPATGEPAGGTARSAGAPVHPLLGRRAAVAALPGARIWERELEVRSLHWLDEHRVRDLAVLPGSAYLEAVLAAAREISDGPLELSDIEIEAPLVLPEGGARRIQVTLEPSGDGAFLFSIFSRGGGEAADDAPWSRHVRGRLEAPDALDTETDGAFDLEAARKSCPTPQLPADHYRSMRLAGLDYGPAFQAIRRLERGESQAVAELELTFAGADASSGYRIHPVLLDAAFQTVAAANGFEYEEGSIPHTFIPVGLERLRFLRPAGPRLWCHASVSNGSDPAQRRADLVLVGPDGARVAEIEGLRLRQLGARAAAGDGAADPLLTLAWRRLDTPPAAPRPRQAGAGFWLILADRDGVGDGLARRLGADGDGAVLVRPGDAYARADGRATLDPENPEDFARLVRETVAAEGAECRGVLHLWSLDAPPLRALSAPQLETAAARGPRSLLYLVQALVRADWERISRMAASRGWHSLPPVWAVTRGAQPVLPGEAPEPAQAALWGAGRGIAREHPELWRGLVDLDPSPQADGAADLAKVLREAAHGDELALRDGAIHVSRLARLEDGGALPAFAADATYLITGGLGDLGLAVARWMAERGARRLVLLGRSPLPPRRRWKDLDPESREAARVRAVLALEELGTSVEVAGFDVADARRLAAFLARERRECRPPVRGVVHSAGALRDGQVEQMTAEDFAAAWRPKVGGAWALHHVLRDEPLDFFVLFSSIASALGSFAQTNYAAGNAFVDALAHTRRAAGLPALAVNWGPWGEIGMAARLGLEGLHSRGGIEALPPAAALGCLERAMAGSEPQVLAVRADWRQWARVQGTTAAARAADLLGEAAQTVAGPAAASTDLRRELGDAAPEERLGRIEEQLAAIVAAVLRLQPAQLDTRQPLSALGLDSIMSAEIATQVGERFGVRLPLGEMLMGVSLAELAATLNQELGSDLGGDAPGSGPDAPAAVAVTVEKGS